MNITTYVESFKKKPYKPKADILERWNNRIVSQGLHNRGRMGASDYLSQYGKGIASKKVVDLALMAEHQKAMDMATGFWEKAYQLETGNSESYSHNGTPVTAAPINVTTARRGTSITLNGIPDHLQPGRIETMQPVDASKPQSNYIVNNDYICQPKRYGHRTIVFGTKDAAAYQSRSTIVSASFDAEIDEACKQAAEEIGAFVVDCEKLYISAEGREHMTSASAATENVNIGQPSVRPIIKLSIFEALYCDKEDLTQSTKVNRIKKGEIVTEAIKRHYHGNGIIEATPTAYTTAEKAALVEKQKSEGREGEVWTCRNTPYIGGKNHDEATVRTKYLLELKVWITNVILSTAEGRTVKSFVVADKNGKSLGKVGGGFDEATGVKLLEAHKKAPGTVIINVLSQGITENGQLVHARIAD